MLRQPRTLYAFETGMFEKLSGLSLCMEEPAPDTANPVLTVGAPGAPDDGKLCYTASVARWGDGYGLWYQAEDRQHRLTRCVAVSPDGLEWEKRGVIGEGIFNSIGNSFNVWNDGNRFIAPLTALGGGCPGSASPNDSPYAPLRLEEIPDARRRTLAAQAIASSGREGITTFIGMATSPDGLQWHMPTHTPRIPMKLEAPWLYRFQGRYIMNAQTNGAWFDPPHPVGRVVVFFSSDDLIHWGIHPRCMTNTAHEAIGGQTHVGIVPIKCIDDRLLIGLGGRFDDAVELTDMHFEVTLLYSYDGLDWKPVAPAHERRNWIRRGRHGEWDFGGVAGMGLIENGDEAAVYYTGTAIGNCSHSFPLYDPGPCAVGRTCFQRDRFAALQPTVGWNAFAITDLAKSARGTLTTHPLELQAGRQLTLNVAFPVNKREAGVEVEILAPDGTLHESARLSNGGIAVPVPLNKPMLEEPVRIRITMTGGSAPDAVPRFFAMEY